MYIAECALAFYSLCIKSLSRPVYYFLWSQTPFLCVIFQVQIYELEEHKIETWRGENVSEISIIFHSSHSHWSS